MKISIHVTIFKQNTFEILNTSCEKKSNLNRQILRGAAGISMNMCMFSDAYILLQQTLLACCFLQ